MQRQTASQPLSTYTPAPSMLLQRKCESGARVSGGGECAANASRRKDLQRMTAGPSSRSDVPALVHDVLRSPGQPLDGATRAFMAPRFGHDFSQVRVHTDAGAACSAGAVNAHAYTVGRHIVFGAGQYSPARTAGERLLAHELAHVVQQRNEGDGWRHEELEIGEAGDALEHEADAMSNRVLAGGQVTPGAASGARTLQRETPGGDSEKILPEKASAGSAIVDGLATVADQAKDNNPQVKKVVIDPIKEQLKAQWGRLDTGDKVATVGFAVGTLGMAGGAMLSDRSGRKVLEGVNLAAPLTLIPYMPLTGFKYALPTGGSQDKRLLKFETSFNADELINLRTTARGLPKMTLSVNLQWGYDVTSEGLRVLGGDASLGIVPGLSLSAGAYKDVLRPPQTIPGGEGQMTQIKKSIPEFDKPQPIPDVRIMITVDLMKFKPADLGRQIEGIFSSGGSR